MALLNEGQLASIREDLAYITRFAAAARLVGDPAVLTEMLDWLGVFHANRGEHAVALNAGLSALAPVIRRTDPAAARLVLDAMQDEPALCRQASAAYAQGPGALAE
jgi:hypothetical protein